MIDIIYNVHYQNLVDKIKNLVVLKHEHSTHEDLLYFMLND